LTGDQPKPGFATAVGRFMYKMCSLRPKVGLVGGCAGIPEVKIALFQRFWGGLYLTGSPRLYVFSLPLCCSWRVADIQAVKRGLEQLVLYLCDGRYRGLVCVEFKSFASYLGSYDPMRWWVCFRLWHRLFPSLRWLWRWSSGGSVVRYGRTRTIDPRRLSLSIHTGFIS